MTLETFQNREAVSFIATGTIAAVIGAVGVRAAGVSPSTAYLVGLAVSIPLEIWRDWLIDWLEARRTTSAMTENGGNADG